MKTNILLKTCLAALPLMLTGNVSAKVVTVTNPAPFDRTGAIVEIPASEMLSSIGNNFIITDSTGKELTHQLTHDNLILVQTDIKGLSSITLNITKGIPSPADTICIGQIRHDFQDDFTWENDRGGYRLYGPSFREGGGNVAGYDIWTKSVDFPVLAQRYDDHCKHGISYHKDYGNGMDCYTVGRTLGAGMNAIVADGEIAYPCAYRTCEIIDNGPLRTSARIICYPENIGNDKNVVEERVITLDRGSWMNKTEVSFKGLSADYPMVTGIVVHKQNPHGVVIDKDKRYVAYADLTDNPDHGNGVIYIGIVNAEMPEAISNEKFDPSVGDAISQVVNHTTISPGETYTYYWGSGWSKGGVKGVDDWTSKLTCFSESLRYPLIIKVD